MMLVESYSLAESVVVIRPKKKRQMKLSASEMLHKGGFEIL